MKPAVSWHTTLLALSDEYGWSNSISNFSNKLTRGSLRYREAIQIADVMGYDLIWQKRRDQ